MLFPIHLGEPGAVKAPGQTGLNPSTLAGTLRAGCQNVSTLIRLYLNVSTALSCNTVSHSPPGKTLRHAIVVCCCVSKRCRKCCCRSL